MALRSVLVTIASTAWLLASSGGQAARGPDPGPTSAPQITEGVTAPAHRPAVGPFAPFDRDARYHSTLYLAPSGSDERGDGSRQAPFLTLGRALQQARPGLRVLLLAGVYPAQGRVTDLHGTASQPIKIEGEDGAVIDVAGGMVALHLRDPRYVVLEHLEIRHSAVHGLNIDDAGTFESPATHIIVRDVRFRAIGSGGNNDCLKMSGVNRFLVERSVFEGCRMGEGIDMVGCHDGVVANNRFADIPGTAVQAKGGSADVLVHGNTFRAIGRHAVNLGGSTNPAVVRPPAARFEGARIRAVANVIEEAGAAAVAFEGCDDCVVAHNTIVRPGRWAARILAGSRDTYTVPSRRGRFVNNVVWFRASDLVAAVDARAGSEPATFAFAGNLWFAEDLPGFEGPAYPPDVSPERGAVVQQDPGFVDARRGDYRLRPGSPAARRAVPLSGAPLYDFVRRRLGRRPSIGAFLPN